MKLVIQFDNSTKVSKNYKRYVTDGTCSSISIVFTAQSSKFLNKQ